MKPVGAEASRERRNNGARRTVGQKRGTKTRRGLLGDPILRLGPVSRPTIRPENRVSGGFAKVSCSDSRFEGSPHFSAFRRASGMDSTVEYV